MMYSSNPKGLDSVVIKNMMIIYHFVVDPDLVLEEILFWKREGNKEVLISN